jgi:hypothetical protein
MGRFTKVLGGLGIASLAAGVVIAYFSIACMYIPGIITGCTLIATSLALEITFKR